MTDIKNEEKKLKQLKFRWLFFSILIFTLYAILRYNVFKGVDPSHFPLYIVNKILSTTGLLLIAMSYAWSKIRWIKHDNQKHDNQLIKFLGLSGFSLSAIHVFISLMIISPEYYPKFYHEGMMNFKGELSMLMGVFSIYCFSIPAITTIPFMQEAVGIKRWQRRQQIGYLGLLTGFLHVVIMGYSGWLDIESWPGYLPPITLIATIIAIIPLFLKLSNR